MVEFSSNQIDNENKPLKGLKDKGLVNFKCEDCGQPLLVLQMTSIGETTVSQVLTRVVVQCGDCGGFSYVQQVEGQFHPGAPSDNMIFDIAEENNNAPDHDILFKAWSR